jgi:hypothetical protein
MSCTTEVMQQTTQGQCEMIKCSHSGCGIHPNRANELSFSSLVLRVDVAIQASWHQCQLTVLMWNPLRYWYCHQKRASWCTHEECHCVARQWPCPCGLHGPGHTALQVPNHPPYSPGLSLPYFQSGPSRKSHDCAVAPAAAQEEDPSLDVSMRCLPQHPWGLFLMGSIPLPRTSLNRFHLNKPHRYTIKPTAVWNRIQNLVPSHSCLI